MTEQELVKARVKKEETIRQAAIAFNKAFKEGKVKKLVHGEWVPVLPEENNNDA